MSTNRAAHTTTLADSAKVPGTGDFTGTRTEPASTEPYGALTTRGVVVDETPPVAVDVATVAVNSGATTLDVLANDIAATDIITVSVPGHGTTAIVAGSPEQVSYTPDADYCNDPGEAATDDFTYMINGEDSATVAITVTCVDETPPPPGPPPPRAPPPPPAPPLPLLVPQSAPVLSGGSGNDRTGGGDGQDRVSGGAGNARLDGITLGGNGRDRLYGGAGNDRVRTAGWTADRVDGGAGDDSALVDVTDRTKRCETVARSSP